jgi:hypothetical protein
VAAPRAFVARPGLRASIHRWRAADYDSPRAGNRLHLEGSSDGEVGSTLRIPDATVLVSASREPGYAAALGTLSSVTRARVREGFTGLARPRKGVAFLPKATAIGAPERNGPWQASGPLRSRKEFADPFLRLLLAWKQ